MAEGAESSAARRAGANAEGQAACRSVPKKQDHGQSAVASARGAIARLFSARSHRQSEIPLRFIRATLLRRSSLSFSHREKVRHLYELR